MLGYSVKPAEARKVARTFFDQGFKRQKWFFMSGPADGAEGLKQNIELVRAVREELGAEAMLMFDGIQYVWKSLGSDRVIADYAITLAKGILPYKPHWLEEPVRPDDLEGYTRVKGETGIVLAAGEHWYTRWNVKPFLDRKHRELRAVGPGVVRRDQRVAEDLRIGHEVSGRAGDPARAPRAGGVELRGVAAGGELPDAGVPDPVADSASALPDAADGGRGRDIRDGRGVGAGAVVGRGADDQAGSLTTGAALIARGRGQKIGNPAAWDKRSGPTIDLRKEYLQ